MKKVFLTFMLSLASILLIGQGYTISVSGYITDESTGDPVADYLVNIATDSMDNNFYYYNVVTTDDNGFYSDLILVPPGLEGELIVWVIGCQGNAYLATGVYSETETDLTISFEICTSPSGGDDCQAMFYAYPTQNSYNIMQFMDASSGSPNSWDWDFGDGGTSTEQNPVHTYAGEGIYDVILTISSDSLDCTSTVMLLVYVGDSIFFPDSCMAMFYALCDTAGSMTYSFIDMSIGEGNNPPDNWYWDFGDGGSSTEQNPVHTFQQEGEYEVCLTISTSDGNCENTYCEYIFVQDWDENCQALFYAYPLMDSVPSGNDLIYQFVDYSYGNPDTWAWEFGDGTSSSEQNPIHMYSAEGTYQVCLTISNMMDSCMSTICQDVEVFSDTTANCLGSFNYSIDNLTVDFEGYLNQSQEGLFGWDFGDGTTGTGSSVSHTYDEDGIYYVLMTAVDSVTGCYTVYTEMLWIGDDITFNVEGYVYLMDSMMADAANVYLMTFDTLFESLVTVAETQTDVYGYYSFDEVGLQNCIYFVQAALAEESDFFDDYVPTYHFSALNWMDANIILPFWNNSYANVQLIPVETNSSGDGMISGFVSNEDGRSLMSDVEILLLNEAGEPLTYVMTDANGEFDFPDLGYGTYIVHTEIMGVVTYPVTVTLTEENPTAELDIVVENGEAILSIKDIQSAYFERVGDIYPNPVLKDARIELVVKQHTDLQLSISNNYGQTVYQIDQSITTGTHQFELNTNHFPKGLYFVSIKTNDGAVLVKKLVKL